MPNQPGTQTFLFNAGLADQVNDDLVANGSALKLENAVFDKLGRIVKRAGHVQLAPDGVIALSDLANPAMLGSLNGGPVIFDSITQGPGAVAYMPDSGALGAFEADAASSTLDVGTAISPATLKKIAAYQDSSTTDPSCAYLNGILAVSSGVGVRFYDATSGACLVDGVETVYGSRIRLFTAGTDYIVALSVTSGSLYCTAFDVSDGSVSLAGSLSSAVALVTMGGDFIYDAYQFSSTEIAVVYRDATNPNTTVRIAQYDFSSGATATTTATASFSVADSSATIGWLAPGPAILRRAVAWGGTSGVYFKWYSSDLSASASAIQLDSSTSANQRNITGFYHGTGDNEVRVLWEVSSASTRTADLIRMATVSSAGTVTLDSTILETLGIRSKVFPATAADGSQQFYFFASRDHSADDSTQDKTLFLVYVSSKRLLRKVTKVGVLLQRKSAGRTTVPAWIHAPVALDNTGRKFAYAAAVRSSFDFEGSTLSERKLTEVFSIDFDATDAAQPRQIARCLFTPGATLGMYDGVQWTSYGIELRPVITISSVNNGAGVMSEGDVRSYRACFVKRDAFGRVFRSAPSVLKSGTVSAGHDALRVTVSAEYPFEDLAVEIYATEFGAGASGILPQLVEVIASPASSNTWDDTVTNAAQNSGTVLYVGDGSTGSELENLAPPGATNVVQWRGRIVVASGETRTEIWISKSLTINTLPGFSESLVVDMPEPVTALAVVDDQLIAFSATAVYRLVEEPPDDTGSGSLPRPQRVGDVGTTYPRMILEHEGVWFQSAKRLLRLSRGASVEFGIADAIENTPATKTPCCAVAIPERSQLRWYYTEGDFVVFDTKRNVWSKCALATNCDVKGVVDLAGDAFLLVDASETSTPSLELWLEDDATYTDPTSSVAASGTTNIVPKIQTPFLGVGQGTLRIHRIYPIGELLGVMLLRAETFTNGDQDSVVETRNVTLSTGSNLEAVMKPATRRCESFSVQFSELAAPASSATAGMALTGVTIEYSIDGRRPHRSSTGTMT